MFTSKWLSTITTNKSHLAGLLTDHPLHLDGVHILGIDWDSCGASRQAEVDVVKQTGELLSEQFSLGLRSIIYFHPACDVLFVWLTLVSSWPRWREGKHVQMRLSSSAKKLQTTIRRCPLIPLPLTLYIYALIYVNTYLLFYFRRAKRTLFQDFPFSKCYPHPDCFIVWEPEEIEFRFQIARFQHTQITFQLLAWLF